MREDERAKKLQPFLQYLNQTPAAELLNDYTYIPTRKMLISSRNAGLGLPRPRTILPPQS